MNVPLNILCRQCSELTCEKPNTSESVKFILIFFKTSSLISKLLYTPWTSSQFSRVSRSFKIDEALFSSSILKLLETLDNCDDVQGVYSNFDIDDEIINKINL